MKGGGQSVPEVIILGLADPPKVRTDDYARPVPKQKQLWQPSTGEDHAGQQASEQKGGVKHGGAKPTTGDLDLRMGAAPYQGGGKGGGGRTGGATGGSAVAPGEWGGAARQKQKTPDFNAEASFPTLGESAAAGYSIFQALLGAAPFVMSSVEKHGLYLNILDSTPGRHGLFTPVQCLRWKRGR